MSLAAAGQNDDSLANRRELRDERMNRIFVGLDVSPSFDHWRVTQPNPNIYFRPGLSSSFGLTFRRHYSEQVSAESGIYFKLYRLCYSYKTKFENTPDGDVLGVLQLPLRINLKKELHTDTYLGFTAGCLLTYAPAYNLRDTLTYRDGLGNFSSNQLSTRSVQQKVGPSLQPVWQLGVNMEFVRKHNFSVEVHLSYYIGPDNFYLDRIYYQEGFGEVQQAKVMLTGSYVAAGLRIHWVGGAIMRFSSREVIVL